MPSGGRYWRFDYSFNDKRRTMALGIYPDVSLALARTRLQEARQRLAMGSIRWSTSVRRAGRSRRSPGIGTGAGRSAGTSGTPTMF